MSPRELLRELRRRGVRVRVDGGDLLLRPGHAVPAGMLDQLREAKPDVVAYLEDPSTYSCVNCGRFHFNRPDQVCFWCRRASSFDVRA